MVKLTTKNYSYHLWVTCASSQSSGLGSANRRRVNVLTDPTSIFTGSNTSRDGASERAIENEKERVTSVECEISSISEDNFWIRLDHQPNPTPSQVKSHQSHGSVDTLFFFNTSTVVGLRVQKRESISRKTTSIVTSPNFERRNPG